MPTPALEVAMPPSLTTALQAVTPAHGRVAASMSVRCAGVRTSACAGKIRYSVSVPSTAPPSAARILVSSGAPLVQFSKKLPMTRSPGANAATPSPTASTTPAPSDSGTSGNFCREP